MFAAAAQVRHRPGKHWPIQSPVKPVKFHQDHPADKYYLRPNVEEQIDASGPEYQVGGPGGQ